MPANEIRIDYEAMEEVARRFQAQAQATETMIARLQASMDRLESGGWVGRGSMAFFREMHQHVLPATFRLAQALEQAHQVTYQVIQVLREAEEEAARLFGQDLGGGQGGSSHAGTGEAPATGVLPSPKDPSLIFNGDYMHRMVGRRIRGADTEALRDAMYVLMDDDASPEAIDKALHRIAEARGLPYETIRAHYQRYLHIREQIAARAQEQGEELPWERSWIYDLVHKDFIGSTPHLRFGQVVGDALGIDPVFGALLSPTGGMVGPDEWQLYPALPEDPLTYHGIFHDAGGFLYNYVGIGPGYNYLGQENARDPGSPLTGQEAGIRYWNDYWERTHGSMGVVDDITETAGSSMGKAQDFLQWLKHTWRQVF